MSVTFSISGERPNHDADACPACKDGEWQTCAACEGSGFSLEYRSGRATPANYVNLCNANAAELLSWLGYEVDAEDLSGVLAPADLRERLERRVAYHPSNVASDLPRGGATLRSEGRATLIVASRPMGYLAARARELLELAERAGDRLVEFS